MAGSYDFDRRVEDQRNSIAKHEMEVAEANAMAQARARRMNIADQLRADQYKQEMETDELKRRNRMGISPLAQQLVDPQSAAFQDIDPATGAAPTPYIDMSIGGLDGSAPAPLASQKNYLAGMSPDDPDVNFLADQYQKMNPEMNRAGILQSMRNTGTVGGDPQANQRVMSPLRKVRPQFEQAASELRTPDSAGYPRAQAAYDNPLRQREAAVSELKTITDMISNLPRNDANLPSYQAQQKSAMRRLAAFDNSNVTTTDEAGAEPVVTPSPAVLKSSPSAPMAEPGSLRVDVSNDTVLKTTPSGVYVKKSDGSTFFRNKAGDETAVQITGAK